MSDVMHGPAVLVAGRRKQKSYLIGLLDDATRIVPVCAFALAESITAFLPVFERAIRRRGIPLRLYADKFSRQAAGDRARDARPRRRPRPGAR